ncbi:ribosome recycling factor family protein [Psychromonas marina]|uniref:ribosome recycling factor family protein n=1 Tax=Psychromonas marina TaxID=88364 RepID=UPI0024E0E84B|nr:ribosome recycling factor family protein [Psychromonas marina]
MPNFTSEILSIKLNNFLHRIDCKATIVEITNQYGCSLMRIRRSKNWSLTGNHHQLIELGHRLREEQLIWIVKAIETGLPPASFNLDQIIKLSPAISVNQLMIETGCTLSEARHAIDAAEGFD